MEQVFKVFDTKRSRYVHGFSKSNAYYTSLRAAKGAISHMGHPYKEQTRYVIHTFDLVRNLEAVV